MRNDRRIIDDQLYVHFVTFSVFRRRKLLNHDHAKRILLGWFNEVLDQYQATCVGFVIMPDHVHGLVWFPRPGQLSKFMHSWKRRSSIGLREWYRRASPKYAAHFGEGDRFWQPKYYAFEIYEPEKLEEKLQYIHLNPVRAGLVTGEPSGGGVPLAGTNGNGLSVFQFGGLNDSNFLWLRHPGSPKRATRGHPAIHT